MTGIEFKIKKAFELSDLLYSRERDGKRFTPNIRRI